VILAVNDDLDVVLADLIPHQDVDLALDTA